MVDLLFKPAQNRGQQAFIDRIVERAKSLIADGYRIQQYGRTTAYAIFKPENRKLTNGYRDYSVDMTPGKNHCDCDCFADVGDCKHRIAVALMLEEQREAAEMLQLELQWSQYEAEQVARLEAEERHLAGYLHRAGIDY